MLMTSRGFQIDAQRVAGLSASTNQIREKKLKTLLSKEIQIQFLIITNGLSMIFGQMMNSQGRYHQTSFASAEAHLILYYQNLLVY